MESEQWEMLLLCNGGMWFNEKEILSRSTITIHFTIDTEQFEALIKDEIELLLEKEFFLTGRLWKSWS